MQFVLTEEQEELRVVARRFLERRSPESVVRDRMADPVGADRSLWRQMADEVGLQGLGIHERYGGSGGSFREVALIMAELGRRVACVPYLSTVCLAASAIANSEDDAAMSTWLPGIANGTLVATIGYLEGGQPWDLDPAVTTTAKQAGGDGEYLVTGSKRYVLDGASADLVLVLAMADDGPGLFGVQTDAPGVESSPLATMDQTRRQAHLSFSGAPGVRVGGAGAGRRLLDSAFDVAFAAIAAESAGGAERCLEMATEYAKVRVQFGRPIGSFQAIKHRCADIYTDLELARAVAAYTAQQVADGSDEARVSASVAKALCTEVFLRAAKDNIQIHGGIGYTWEHSAHLYLKRAKSNQVLFGDTALQHRRVGQLIGV